MSDTDDTGLSQEQYDLLLKIFSPSEEDEDTDVYVFLEKITTPEELHQLAINYNWDDGIGIPDWIIRQPFCDRGTALLVYWHAAPRPNYEYANRDEVLKKRGSISEYEIEYYDLVKEIETRYLTGFYTQQNIAYDPTNDQGHDFTQEYLEYEAKQILPSIMLEATPGKVLERASF
jgi:hypothetical protein